MVKVPSLAKRGNHLYWHLPHSNCCIVTFIRHLLLVLDIYAYLCKVNYIYRLVYSNVRNKMAKASAIIGLVFTIAFTVIMANYTYNAWLEYQDAQKQVQILQKDLETATNEYNQAYSEVAGTGGVVGSQ